MEQLNLFEQVKPKYKINKPVRLIELFAGIGSQAKALERLGVDFEHYKVVEFDEHAIKSYNAIHGTNFASQDITQTHAKDLEIIDKDRYCYLMTYSYPCQDLSLAGKGRGMKKGSGTRSGLLWEVERILDECKGELPQILLMENVPQVLAEKNINDFHSWQRKLEQLGYSNYVELLNAKDYGIPQNRNRCFMVSILGDYYYSFPQKQELKLKLKDMLEKDVDEKYYLSDKMINCFMSDGTGNYPRRERFLQNINRKNQDISNAITTHAGSRPTDNFVIPKTLMETLETNDIPDGINMIDAYNRNIRDDELSGTITARIDDSNHYIAIKNEISYRHCSKGNYTNNKNNL